MLTRENACRMSAKSLRGSNKVQSADSAALWTLVSKRSRTWHRWRACPHDRHKQCDAHRATANHGMVASTRDGSGHVAPSCCSFSRRAPTA
eukprot:3765437-Pleurochrysis_carterae.AAC.1